MITEKLLDIPYPVVQRVAVYNTLVIGILTKQVESDPSLAEASIKEVLDGNTLKAVGVSLSDNSTVGNLLADMLALNKLLAALATA